MVSSPGGERSRGVRRGRVGKVEDQRTTSIVSCRSIRPQRLRSCRAAYRALARRYHPDGEDPDPARMAVLNRVYALVRTPELRAAYDRGRSGLRPVGPGYGGQEATAPPPASTSHGPC